MSALRVVLVTRRYWPLVGGAETFMMQLADDLRLKGHHVHVLTAQWESHWPTDVMMREVPTTRLAHPAVPGWRTFRYMRALSRWLRSHAADYDLVYVVGLRYDAYAALGALRGTKPILLRTEARRASSDCEWHNHTRFGKRLRLRCMNADAIVVPSEAVRDDLQQAHFATNRLHVIEHGVDVGNAVDSHQQSLSRHAVAAVNHDLVADPDVPVAVCISPLQQSQGLRSLLQAWRHVAQQIPAARLWIVGDGPDRDSLYELILELDLRNHVVMPGTFDVNGDLLAAANLYVSPDRDDCGTLALLEAMATGVPVVAVDTTTNQRLVHHEEHGLLVQAEDADALAVAILRQFQQQILAQHWASAARERVARDFTTVRCLDAHIALFESVLKRK